MIFKAYLFEGDFEKHRNEVSNDLIREGIFKYIASKEAESEAESDRKAKAERESESKTANEPERKGDFDYEKLWEEIQRLEIKRAEKGKPYLDLEDIYSNTGNSCLVEQKLIESGLNLSDICFNLSHSGQMAVLMIGESECGIDLQVMEVKNHKAIAKKYYTENEQTFVDKYGLEGFFRIWVHREAFGKLSGEGVLSEMPDFVDGNGQIKIEVKSPLDDRSVYIKDIPVSKDIFMAFATYGEDDEIELEL